MDTNDKRQAKKSETLQVRLPFGMKSRFLELCHRSGTTASDVLRAAISSYLARAEQPCSTTGTGTRSMIVSFAKRRKRTLATGAGAIAVAGLLALPSAAGPDLRAEFARDDVDGDGVITFAEFSRGEVPAEEVARARLAAREDFRADEPRVVREAYMVRIPPAQDPDEWRLEMIVRLTVGEWEGRRDGRHPVRPPDHPLAYEFVDMDADGDDAVTFEEWQVHRHRLLTAGFRFLDADADGWMSLDEFEGTLGHDVFLPSNDVERSALDLALTSVTQLRDGFRLLDANGDLRLSLEEYFSVG